MSLQRWVTSLERSAFVDRGHGLARVLPNIAKVDVAAGVIGIDPLVALDASEMRHHAGKI